MPMPGLAHCLRPAMPPAKALVSLKAVAVWWPLATITAGASPTHAVIHQQVSSACAMFKGTGGVVATVNTTSIEAGTSAAP